MSMQDPVIVLDNGGGTLKVGLSGPSAEPSIFPNAVGKLKGDRHILLADQIVKQSDLSALLLRRPTDRGFVINWNQERLIWERSWHATNLVPSECGLLVTEPPFNLMDLQQQMDQVIFEEFQFKSCYASTAAELCIQHWASQRPDLPSNQAFCGLVIDCGFSFSHILPVFDGRLILEGVQRLNLGGKALTNYMKELVSFRSVNMMEETYLMEHIKEQTAFTAQELSQDLLKAKSGAYKLEYVLPDGLTNGKGYIRQPMQKADKQSAPAKELPVLNLNNERFLVPELLFSPRNVGLHQAGLAEAAMNSVNKVHPDIRPLLLGNIVCCGGTFKCPGLSARLKAEILSLAPSHFRVDVHTPANPSTAAWHGGNIVASSAAYYSLAWTKAQYEEQGSSYMRHGKHARSMTAF